MNCIKPNDRIPPKLDKSAVRSDRLKFHGIWSSDLEIAVFPSAASWSPAGLATSDTKAVSKADASAFIPDKSDAVKGKRPLDATDVGLIAMSDIGDIELIDGITGAISEALWSITILQQRQNKLPLAFFLSRKILKKSKTNK